MEGISTFFVILQQNKHVDEIYRAKHADHEADIPRSH